MVTITIANTDRTDWVDWGSLRIDNILTNQVARCTFVIRNPDLSGGTFKPTVGNEVIWLEVGILRFLLNYKRLAKS